MALVVTLTRSVSSHILLSLLLIPFFTSLFVRLSHPCYISPLKTPTEWKTAGSGTAQSTLCPILQWIPIYLSPLPLCPARSPAPCPHLRWGRAAETKEKQPAWEHVSHPHMVHFLPLLLSLNLFPNPTPWRSSCCYDCFYFWQAEKRWDIMQLSRMAKYAYRVMCQNY